jgi:superfamily I DNA and/or RNA helicase/very-short-patch-repair endonuclease
MSPSRRLELKYPGKCSKCGTYIPVGKLAIWVSSSKSVHCIKCPATPSPSPQRFKNKKNNRDFEGRIVENSSYFKNFKVDETKISSENIEWFRYCNYLADCVYFESQIEPPSTGNKRRYKTFAKKVENPFSEKIELNDEETRFLEKVESGRSVILGWPILAIGGKEGNWLVPLFQTEVDVSNTLETGFIQSINTEWRTSDLLNSTTQIEESDIQQLQDLISSQMDLKSSASKKKIDKEVGILFPMWQKSKNAEPSELAIGEFSDQPLLLIGSESQFSQSLVKELREIATRTDWKKSAAAQLFDSHYSDHNDYFEVAAPLALNESQEEAVSKLSSNRTVVVTGPPGTGKSQLISSLVAHSWISNQSLLISSVNNAAVDIAVQRIKSIDPALVLRTGNKASRELLSAELESFSERAANIQKNSRENQREINQLRKRYQSNCKSRKRLMSGYREYLKKQGELASVTEELIQLNFEIWESGSNPISKNLLLFKALVKSLKENSDVSKFRTRIKTKYLKRKFGVKNCDFVKLTQWVALQKQFKRNLKSLKKNAHKVIAESQLKIFDDTWKEDSSNLLKAILRTSLQRNKSQLTSLRTAVLKGNYQAVLSSSNLKIFPSWAVTAYSASTAAPLTSSLIDLVVVDEASQCSIAAILPLAYRAKKLMILGDSNQLRPIIKLSEIDDKFSSERNLLNYEDLREKNLDHRTSSAFSAFDKATSVDAKVLLDEHYRSHSSISHWFNANFYSGNLTLLGSRPSKSLSQGLFWRDIYGNWERGNRGSYLNIAECTEVVKIVKENSTNGISIGVVTPYALQAQEIRDLITKDLSEEILHEIEFVSSTAHRFQGGEKDLIIYSTVITPETPQRSADWIKKNRELINVAVSRARESLIVVGHPDAPQVLNIGDLVSLKKATSMTKNNLNGEDLVQTCAEKVLYLGLLEKNIVAAPQLPISGLIVDFALPSNKYEGLVIEVDGSVHQDERGIRIRQDFQRDRMLTDLGWQVIRIPNWRIFSDLPGVIDEISKKLNEEILPTI